MRSPPMPKDCADAAAAAIARFTPPLSPSAFMHRVVSYSTEPVKLHCDFFGAKSEGASR